MLTQIVVFNVSTSVTKPDFIAAAVVGLLIRDASNDTGVQDSFNLGGRKFLAQISNH